MYTVQLMLVLQNVKFAQRNFNNSKIFHHITLLLNSVFEDCCIRWFCACPVPYPGEGGVFLCGCSCVDGQCSVTVWGFADI